MQTMSIAKVALLLIALISSGAAPRAEEPRWQLGEPEVVWRNPNTFNPEDFPASLVLHPRGGFVLVSQVGVSSVRVQRFASNWRQLWSSYVSSSQSIHVAILPSGHIVLSRAATLTLLAPDGSFAWGRGAGRGQGEAFAGFQVFGSVVPSGDDFVVGGYGSSAVR
jgi:hypothetical protein